MKYILLVILLWISTASVYAKSIFYEHYISSQCQRYVPASNDELTALVPIFSQALEGRDLDSALLKQSWLKYGFDWVRVSKSKMIWWLAVDNMKDCQGQGFYAFKENVTSPNLLQIPHRYSDQYTGKLGRLWMKSSSLSAIAWNTSKRNLLDKEGFSADLAHRNDSYFSALTQAFAGLNTTASLFQLHGFSNAKRFSIAGKKANIIVSSGHKWSSHYALDMAVCLSQQVDEVLLFPRDVGELGATKNSQGKQLRNLGHNGFTHIELSRTMRQRLLSNKVLRAAIAGCFTNNKVSKK